ncbi:MAG TPA: homoserine dehydrogenase, partial [Isosphaeraceae bacterium]|nr:homoserine dehydrogenase [Isosphaeraceae bacterium]
MDAVSVGLLGLGHVGSEVARLLDRESGRIARRSGRPIQVVSALVRDPSRDRKVPLRRDQIGTDWRRVVEDPRVSVVIELMGGTTDTLPIMLGALEAGKDVVTANKALLAEHGSEIFAQARKHGRSVSFEASVGGGIPIVQALAVGLAANQVQSL